MTNKIQDLFSNYSNNGKNFYRDKDSAISFTFASSSSERRIFSPDNLPGIKGKFAFPDLIVENRYSIENKKTSSTAFGSSFDSVSKKRANLKEKFKNASLAHDLGSSHKNILIICRLDLSQSDKKMAKIMDFKKMKERDIHSKFILKKEKEFSWIIPNFKILTGGKFRINNSSIERY